MFTSSRSGQDRADFLGFGPISSHELRYMHQEDEKLLAKMIANHPELSPECPEWGLRSTRSPSARASTQLAIEIGVLHDLSLISERNACCQLV